MKLKFFPTIVCIIIFSFNSLSQNEPLWLRYPAISPDGSTILFNYKGDIYKVSSSGGMAIPLTLSESYEYSAVWSKDGETIAFASDRYGNFDIFKMPAKGGEAKRLTFHSTNEKPSSFSINNSEIVFTALRQDLHTNVQFPTGVMPELYSVPVTGGRIKQIVTTPAHDATFSPDGNKIIFHDQKGYENDWRKHHTSSVTRDIWVYDIVNKSYKQLSHFNGEDRNPVFYDNDKFYYLSEESGSFNIHKSSLSQPDINEAITTFKSHPVRFLTSSKNNTLCFSYHGEVYTLKEGEEAKKVNVTIAYDGRGNIEKRIPVNNFTEARLSPNGKEFAYVFRGEIFVSSIENGTTKRITNTARQERSVSFSPDGKSLIYAAESDSSWNIYTKSLIREEEPYFYMSTILKDDVVTATIEEEFQPEYSPDGKEVAYLENRTTLKIINIESKKSRVVLPSSYNYSYSDGDQYFTWSPDSKWLLVSFGPKENIFQREIGLINASGKGELKNLTRSGYQEVGPKWVMDGKMMLFGSTREGNKTEQGGTGSGNIYGLFFTKAAFDKFNLSKEEAELAKELEEKEKEDKENKDDSIKANKGKDANKDSEEKVEDLKFDWESLLDRKTTLTVHTSNLSDWLLSKEGDKLFYMTRFEGKNNLWTTDLKTKETKLFSKINAGRTSMELSDDGNFIFILADGKPMKVDVKDGKSKSIKTSGEMVLQTDRERAYIFEHCWRQVREKFYVPDLQGVDWDFYYSEYKKFLPFINNNYDYAEFLSEMLGELNASHTGGRYRHDVQNGDQTTSLGILYDYSHYADGLKVAEVLNGGPADKAASKIAKGNIIEKIDGNVLSTNLDFYQFLNRKAKKNTLLDLYNPETGERWQEVLKPISLSEENELLYQRWVKSRRKEVEKLSDGRLGYVHVRSMNDASMRTVYEDALGKHIGAEALVVDTRFNGGGNLHDVLSDFLNGKKYMDIIPHGQHIGSQPRNRWTKPSIVVMGESNYSDAHLFPVAYKIKDVGKNLGMPVPGTGTFVWWEGQIDPTIVFGIPMGGWKPLNEPFLENNQLEPDIKVANEPDKMAAGRDQQIEEAIKELQK
ncbi:S41 family peptidase [uncultured Draconibacterium sp.]|uniref:S41 family peptidase n=1 Tax=uncultured Draconibacterium sp. TaxID=1573823 RepID=UPI0025F009EE|nr:S41 family peptidase [uncultured Draconibacterium sp.]